MSKPRTSFDVTREDMAALRALAAELGLVISRGPGAGELGNITQLLTRLAAAYRRDRARTVDGVATLVGLPPPRDDRGPAGHATA